MPTTPQNFGPIVDSLQAEIARQHGLLEAAATRTVNVTTPSPPAQPWWDSNTFSALAGAVIGGLMVMLAEAARQRLERGRVHRTGLVRLERTCASYLKEITLNSGFALQAERAAGRASLFWKLPHPFEIDVSLAIDIFNLDMNTRVASLNNNLMRYNRTIDHLRRVRDSLQAAQLGGTLQTEVWLRAMKDEGPQWKALREVLKKMDSAVRDLKVRAVLMARQYDSRRAKVLRCGGLGTFRTWPLSEEAVAAMRQELDAARDKEHNEHMQRIEDELSGREGGVVPPGNA